MARYVLGYVDSPMPGHEAYDGMLAIPYTRRDARGKRSVVSIRFRCITDGCGHQGHGKYNTAPGDRPRLYNTGALMQDSDTICITEGELDTIVLGVLGVPSVGVPGAQAWRDHFTPAFVGYEAVFVLTDGDTAGTQFGSAIKDRLSNAKVVRCPTGHDVNSWVHELDGASDLRKAIS